MRRFWLILLVWWATAVSAGSVWAHAELISATPAPGSFVVSLTEIQLVFSEPVGANSRVELLQDFVMAAELQPVLDRNDATVLRAAVPPLPDGIYTVQWHVTSADGHPISGSYSLGINGTAQNSVPWYQTALALLGLLLSGLSLFILVLRRRRIPAVPQRHSNN